MRTAVPPELSTAHAITSARLRVAAGRTQERTPTLETNSNLRTKSKKLRYRLSVIGSVAPPRNRLGARKAYAGTWPNENKFMLLVPAVLRKGGGYRRFAQEDVTCGLRASANRLTGAVTAMAQQECLAEARKPKP